MRRRNPRYTLLEIVISLLVIAGLLYGLLRALDYMQERAEKSYLEQQLAALRNALVLEASSRLVRGRAESLSLLEGENPMLWLQSKPEGYRGEFAIAPVGKAAAASWYYDSRRKELVYVPLRSDWLRVPAGRAAELRFRVVVGRNGDFGPNGVEVLPIFSYTWF